MAKLAEFLHTLVSWSFREGEFTDLTKCLFWFILLMGRSGGMADAAVSKTVEGQPHVGSTPTFGTTDIWQYAPGYHPWGTGSGSIDDINSRAKPC